jgi:hypothetical protein
MYTQCKPILLALLFIFHCTLICMQGITFPASNSHEPQSLEPVFKLRKSRISTAGLYKRRLQTDHTSLAITDGSLYPIISAPGISDKSVMAFLELATNITRSIDIALQKIEESKPAHIPTPHPCLLTAPLSPQQFFVEFVFAKLMLCYQVDAPSTRAAPPAAELN